MRRLPCVCPLSRFNGATPTSLAICWRERCPERARPQEKRAKERTHHTQVLPEQISRAFAEARNAAGIMGKNAPTFHEIRSLGGALLREAGWSVEQVQDLMTHTSEAMTEHYLGGHEAPWTDVSIGISLKR